MTLSERLYEVDSINRQLQWIAEDVGGNVATKEQFAEFDRLTKLSAELISAIPVMFGSQTYIIGPENE